MNAIFKYGNVYVTTPSKKIREDINVADIPELICDNYNKCSVRLYGGRIHIYITNSEVEMYIDGIDIYSIDIISQGKYKIYNEINTTTATAYLNQIENLGVDTFLDNYKIQLQTLKTEIEKSAQQLEIELSAEPDKEKSSLLDNFRYSIRKLSCILCMLLINLNAGLDNHDYTEAFDNIVNLYFS